jgi:hypothetical protein
MHTGRKQPWSQRWFQIWLGIHGRSLSHPAISRIMDYSPEPWGDMSQNMTENMVGKMATKSQTWSKTWSETISKYFSVGIGSTHSVNLPFRLAPRLTKLQLHVAIIHESAVSCCQIYMKLEFRVARIYETAVSQCQKSNKLQFRVGHDP